MSGISTHILDTSIGKPVASIAVVLERKTHTSGWQIVKETMTNADGRAADLMPPDQALPGHYRLVYEIGTYFAMRGIDCFFPHITINFVIKDQAQHYHIPLLLGPFGYTTYRGS